MRRALLIGEASHGGEPFDGPGSGARLEALLGRPVAEVFDVRNLFPEWPGKDGKGDAFPLEMARYHARSMLHEVLSRRRVVFVGRRVAEAFFTTAMRGWPYLTWWPEDAPARRSTFAILPHPSGINLWWNEAENVEAARHFLCELAAERSRRADANARLLTLQSGTHEAGE